MSCNAAKRQVLQDDTPPGWWRAAIAGGRWPQRWAASGEFRQKHLVTEKRPPESFASLGIRRRPGKPLRTKARPYGQRIAYAVAMHLERPAKRSASQPTSAASPASSQPDAFWLSDSGSRVSGGFRKAAGRALGYGAFMPNARFRRFGEGLSTGVMNHCSSGWISGRLSKPDNLEEPRGAPLTMSAVR